VILARCVNVVVLAQVAPGEFSDTLQAAGP